MSTSKGSSASRTAIRSSEDRLLLEEHMHRTANEVAAALAALRLAAKRGTRTATREMIEAAIERLEGFGECSRLLGTPASDRVDVGLHIAQVCEAVVRGRMTRGPRRVVLNLPSVEVEGETARRLGLVAHELVTNALKHALLDGGSLEIRLERLSTDIVLSVIDDGPGLGSSRGSLTSGTRLGGRIIGELVRGVGGSMDCDTGPGGTAIHVMLPLDNDPFDGIAVHG